MTGVVVAVDEFSGRIVLTIDDSSGINIEATCVAPPKPEAPPLDPVERAKYIAEKRAAPTKPEELISPDGPNLTNIDVGSVVKIKGGITIFREQKQVMLKSIVILGDTNAEVKCWNEVAVFHREVLSKPWIVTSEEEASCRREADAEKELEREEEQSMKEAAEKKKKKELRRHLKEKRLQLQEKHRQADSDGDKSKGSSTKRGASGLREAGHGEKRKKERGNSEGLDPENKVNYPSRAARKRAAGKFDALGI